MMKKLFILFLIIVFPIFLTAQEIKLFEPLSYQNAVKKGTRSRDGKPGPDYWQNHADYDIKVKLDTAVHRIFGEETVLYYNSSPDNINNLVIRLYPNLFKKGAIRNRLVSGADLHDGVEINSFKINNELIDLSRGSASANGTNLLIPLQKSLTPGEKLQIECKWNYLVPVETKDRVGYYKDGAWFIGYFYPQIAVYDDLEAYPGIPGWDYVLFHMGIQQFYNDFNNFKVSIEVPEGYYVWGTGDVVNEKEVYPASVLKKLNEARSSDNVIHILTSEDHDKYKPGSIWKFEANHVPDFAFGTSLTYLWDGTSAQIGNKRVFTDAVYHPDSKLYSLAAGIIKEGINYTSEVYPAVEFPYQHATVFNGKRSGGMEFPMIANNADVRDTMALYSVTFHEVFHNYMPFMMGFNEKRYGFMDEGMTEYYTGYFQLNHLKKQGPVNRNPLEYYKNFVLFADAPLIYSTAMENRFNTGLLDYRKPRLVYDLFAKMVGEEAFRKAMQQFVKRWQGKHPTPWDFFYTMNNALNENYNWFWKAWFFDFAYPDLGLKRNKNVLTVERVGADALPVPVNLIVTYKDGTSDKISKSMKVWKDGAKEIGLKLNDIDKIESVRVDTESVPDINDANNSIILN